MLRERFLMGEVTGLSDEMLGELAVINYVIDSRGRTAIEDKASVRSALGRSPDYAHVGFVESRNLEAILFEDVR
jgi:hypothetical protein